MMVKLFAVAADKTKSSGGIFLIIFPINSSIVIMFLPIDGSL